MSALLIAGLGNPGVKYGKTRHNVGFMVLDFLSKALGFDFAFDKKFNAELGVLKAHNQTLYFLKPQTFMNLSGESIAPFSRYFQLSRVLVIHDELDIPFGDIRFKFAGSSGGHNGLKSIDSTMGNEYVRLRFGIGRSVAQSVVDYVLSDFSLQERQGIDMLMPHLQEAILSFAQMERDNPQESLKDITRALQSRFGINARQNASKHTALKYATSKQNMGDKKPQAKDSVNSLDSKQNPLESQKLETCSHFPQNYKR